MNISTRDIEIALAVLFIFNSVWIFEVVGLLPDTPFHSISYWSHLYPWVKWTIFVLGAIFESWWLWHTSHQIPKLLRRLRIFRSK